MYNLMFLVNSNSGIKNRYTKKIKNKLLMSKYYCFCFVSQILIKVLHKFNIEEVGSLRKEVSRILECIGMRVQAFLSFKKYTYTHTILKLPLTGGMQREPVREWWGLVQKHIRSWAPPCQ